MKLSVKCAVSLGLIVMMSGCLNQTNDNEFTSDLEYDVYFNGFLVYENDVAPPLEEVLVFESEEEWQQFSQRYVYEGNRVASMDRQIDWNKESLIYYAMTGAKPGYVYAPVFQGYQMENNEIHMHFEDTDEPNKMVAVNTLDSDDYNIAFLAWGIVAKEDLPDNVKDSYQ